MSEPIKSIEQNNYILSTPQEVSHDNTLSGNGTVDSPLGVVNGYNETVLYNGAPTNSNILLSENCTNFEYIEVYGVWDYNGSEDGNRGIHAYAYAKVPSSAVSFQITAIGINSLVATTGSYYITTLNYRPNSAELIKLGSYRSLADGGNFSTTDTLKIFKVIGINRIANN